MVSKSSHRSKHREYYYSHSTDWEMGTHVLLSNATKCIDDKAGKRTWVWATLASRRGKQFASLPHTHKWSFALDLFSYLALKILANLTTTAITSLSKTFHKDDNFFIRKPTLPSNPTCCPDTSDVIQAVGSKQHLVKHDDSVESGKTRTGRAKYVFEGIPLKFQKLGSQHSDGNKITSGINLAWDQLHLPL